MIDFSLSSNRLIGMIQADRNKKLYKIGCIGKISFFYETNDGRYIISLLGKNYFTIKKILSSLKKIKIADVEIKNNENQIACNSLDNFNKNLLLNKY